MEKENSPGEMVEISGLMSNISYSNWQVFFIRAFIHRVRDLHLSKAHKTGITFINLRDNGNTVKSNSSNTVCTDFKLLAKPVVH